MLLILNSGIARVETIWPSPAGIQVNVTFDNNAQQVKFIYSGIQQEYRLLQICFLFIHAISYEFRA